MSMGKVGVQKLAESIKLDEDTVDEAEDEEDPKAFLIEHILEMLEALSRMKFVALKNKAKEEFQVTQEQIKKVTSDAEDKKAAVIRLIFDQAVAQAGGPGGATVSGSLTASEATLRAQGFASLPAEERQQILQDALEERRKGQWVILRPLGKGGQAMVYHIAPVTTATAGSSGTRMERAFKVVPYVDVEMKGKLER